MKEARATKGKKRFNRLNDRFFKFLFANENYKALLIAFLNEVLSNIPAGALPLPLIVDIRYMDREAVACTQHDKLPRFDVLAVAEDGRILHIEVQVARDENILSRVLFYGAKNYVTCTRKGEDYSSAQVICVVLVNFRLFQDTEAYHTLHRLVNVETGSWDMRGMEFHFIELPKLRRRGGEPGTGLERILYYLGDIGGDEMMQTLASEDARVATMMELERIFCSDPTLWSDYMTWERERLDYQAELKAREVRGEQRGEKRGENFFDYLMCDTKKRPVHSIFVHDHGLESHRR